MNIFYKIISKFKKHKYTSNFSKGCTVDEAKIAYNKLKLLYPESKICVIGSEEDINKAKD